jgi:O-antigen ligase
MGSLFTGHGAGSFYYLNGINQAHNILVMSLLEVGVAGVLLLLAIWVVQFKSLRAAGASRNLRNCLLFALMCVITGSLFLNWETRKGVFLVYGMIQAYSTYTLKGPNAARSFAPAFGFQLPHGKPQ